MNPAKLIAANKRYDAEFLEAHPDFVKWWHTHPHCDLNPKFAVAPRVAFKCRCYQDEYLEGKQFGLNEVERSLSKPA